MLLLIKLFGEKYMNMYTFREICPECGYSHNIRFYDIPDRLVQGKKNNIPGVLISCKLSTGRLGQHILFQKIWKAISLNYLQTKPSAA